MSESTLELWPPPPEALRALRRRTSGFFAVLFGGVSLLVMAIVGVVIYSRFGKSVDLASKAPFFLAASAAVAVLFGGLALAIGYATTRNMGKVMERARGMVAHQLNEEVQTYCTAAFLGARVYLPGVFVVTNRRLLRCHGTFKGYKQTVLAGRDQVECIARTQRHSMRGRALGLLLKHQGVDEGLTLTTTDGQTHFFVVAEMFLDRLFPWLEAQGFPCDHRNDADLQERPQVTPVVFEEHRDRAMGRRNMQTVVVPLLLSLLSVSLLVGLEVAGSIRRAKNPIRSRFIQLQAVPALKNGQVSVYRSKWGAWLPSGTALPSGMTTRVGDVLVALPGRPLESFSVVRIDGVPFLQDSVSPPPAPVEGDRWVQGWERLGDASLSDRDVLDLAEERISGR